MILKGRIDRTSIIPLGVNSDGTVITAQELVVKKVGRRSVSTFGDVHAYTIIDLPTAAGGFSVTQGTTPWKTQTAAFTFPLLQGNPLLAATTVAIIVKMVFIKTSAAAGNRALIIGAGVVPNVSTKTVGPSSSGSLIDAEIALPSGSQLNINNLDTVSGDNVALSYVKLA